jgi:phosphatidylinositol-3-phosphatase
MRRACTLAFVLLAGLMTNAAVVGAQTHPVAYAANHGRHCRRHHHRIRCPAMHHRRRHPPKARPTAGAPRRGPGATFTTITTTSTGSPVPTGGTPSRSPIPSPPPPPPPAATISHVVVIVMENEGTSILSQMPYLSSLASTYGQATNYRAIGHFSADNYIAMTSGTTCCFDDSFQNLTSTPSIFGQLGAEAQTLAEQGGGGYAQRHDPGSYYGFSSVGYTDGQSVDLTGKKYTFVVPGLCDDMHDCGASVGDAWLSRNVPKFQANPNTAIFVVFDEAAGGGQGPTTPPANGVPMIVVSPYTSHVQDATAYTHYSLLRTAEDLLGLPCLGSACSASSMVGHFGF